MLYPYNYLMHFPSNLPRMQDPHLSSIVVPVYDAHVLKHRTCVLAQKPITLVLMMINSYSYSTNDLVFIKFQIFNQDLS